jgi:hypothetical protein
MSQCEAVKIVKADNMQGICLKGQFVDALRWRLM